MHYLLIASFCTLLACTSSQGVSKSGDGALEKCTDDTSLETKKNVAMVIRQTDSFWLMYPAGGDGSSRYSACNLPESMQVEGKAVTVDITMLPMLPNARYVATPIQLDKIVTE